MDDLLESVVNLNGQVVSLNERVGNGNEQVDGENGRGVESPPPDTNPHAGYAFEYPVTEYHADGTTSQGRMDM